MSFPVIKKASYILVNTPDMVIHNGTTQMLERKSNLDSEYLKKLKDHLRPFDEVVAYAPNQTYIGNMTPDQLSGLKRPWYSSKVEDANRFGKFGEIMPQDEFYGLLKVSDVFDLVILEKSYTEIVREKFRNHPILNEKAEGLKEGEDIEEIEKLMKNGISEGLYENGKLIGCVKRAHEFDINLSSHTILENLVVKASGVLALMHLIKNSGVDVKEVEYLIECSEEAIGDMNQRGGGNVAKACGEIAGIKGATGTDMRGFCAGPTHALITASALVKSGVYKNVIIFAGGCTAKLGMNGRDHVKKGLPALEDCLGGFAILVCENDGVSPMLRTDVVGRHTIGHGSAPQAVMEALVLEPLTKNGMKITDVDKYAPEMQTPDITESAGAGDVPTQNYKMIGALAVKSGQLDRKELPNFVKDHGYPGFAPTQGHIPSGVPIVGHGIDHILNGKLNNFMVVGKGSLFLGRMTNLFDGVSILVEKNTGVEQESVRVSKEKTKIGLTTFGSEHGVDEMIKAVQMAKSKYDDFDIVLIGPKVEGDFDIVEVKDSEEGHKKMVQLLARKEIDGCVTQHFDFPIGVSTVGRVVTPGKGNELIIATTTGTTSTNRVEGMIKNAIAGIAVAKSVGIKNPTVGILNVDGAREVERALSDLQSRGYQFQFSESLRADGGAIMRGNDLLAGTPDVMVCDSLTGNLLIKIFAAYTTSGNYETLGYGYGPGIGQDYDKLVNIVSRASGAPLICEALRYCATCAENDVLQKAKEEFKKAKEAGLEEVIFKLLSKERLLVDETVKMPAKKVVTYTIQGVDILELENACKVLWREGIYAESGMGCTGPVILVSEEEGEKAIEVLKKNGFK